LLALELFDELYSGLFSVGAGAIEVSFDVSHAGLVGMVLSAPLAVAAALEPLLFLLADRWPRRWFISGGLLVMGLAAAGCALAPSPLWFALALTVSHVAKEDRHWRVHFAPTEDPDAPLRSVEAKTVVLSAGTLGSTEILLRSREEGLPVSDSLGQRFSANGDIIAFALGRSERVNSLRVGPPPKVHDLAGRMRLPGFQDSHVHPPAGGLHAGWPAGGPGWAVVVRLTTTVWTIESSRVSASFRVTCFCICPAARYGRPSLAL